MITKERGKYVLRSKRSKKALGRFATKTLALKREQQIRFFKHQENK